MEVGLAKQDLRRLLGRHRLDRRSPSVPQDRGVEAILEANVTKVWVGSNPVVVNRLVGGELRLHSISISFQYTAHRYPPQTSNAGQ